MRRTVLAVVTIAGLVAMLDEPSRAYVLLGKVWGQTTVNYYVNPATPDMSQQSAIAAIQAAAANWSEQSNANIRLAYAGTTSSATAAYNGKNIVFFRNSSNGYTAATTYYWYNTYGKLVDSDTMFYDAGFKFYPGASGCTGSGAYLEDMATHEFGHALGLKHTGVSGATMYATTSYCSQNWRVLDIDDINGIEKAYPSTSSSTTTTLPATPILYLPLNLATAVTNLITGGSYVRWYTCARATSYDVYFGTSSNPPKIATVVPPAGLSTVVLGTMYQSVSRAAHTTYYWRVVAKNSAGSTSGPVWKFTTF